jgi:hypothetical protein
MEKNEEIKNQLYLKLLEEHAFWSFDMSNQKKVPDTVLICKTIIHLDIEEINLLFKAFPKKYVMKIWREEIVIQGDYYRYLNRLIAYLYFDIKKPDQYIKTVITKHYKKLSEL